MSKIELSDRLLHVAEFTVANQPIADIGSDHAYLPIYLVQNKWIPKAIAGEVAEGPLKNAKQTVDTYGLEEKIDVRYGDGLNVLQEDEKVGTIFICGMGGSLISEILSNGNQNLKLPKDARLVLQPNNAENRLREFLMDNQYEIIKEDMVEEKGKMYEIIVAEYAKEKQIYSEEELFFGPKLLEERSTTFLHKWEEELLKTEHIYKQVKGSRNEEKIQAFQKIIETIKKVIQ